MIEKNVLLYWHSPSVPVEVQEIVKEFETQWPECSVVFLTDETAREFLRFEYGQTVESAFQACRIPAMRSDFLRLAWIFKCGGMWIDMKFRPRNFPQELFSSEKSFICCKWFHGEIVNGVFLASRENPVLGNIFDAALLNIAHRRGNNIHSITGPALWRKLLSKQTEERIQILDHDYLFSKFLRKQSFSLSGRDTDMHWSIRQKSESLYIY